MPYKDHINKLVEFWLKGYVIERTEFPSCKVTLFQRPEFDFTQGKFAKRAHEEPDWSSLDPADVWRIQGL